MNRRVLIWVGSILTVALAGCGAAQTAASAPTTVNVTASGEAPAAQISTTTVTVTASSSAAAEPAPSSADAALSTSAEAGTTTVGGSVEYSSEYPSGEATATLQSAEWTAEAGQYTGPPENGTYLVVEVTVESRSGEVSVNPLLWQVKDADGRTYSAELGGVDGQLSSGDLAVGGKSRGFVAFDAPQGPVTLELTGFAGPPLASWSIPA